MNHYRIKYRHNVHYRLRRPGLAGCMSRSYKHTRTVIYLRKVTAMMNQKRVHADKPYSSRTYQKRKPV